MGQVDVYDLLYRRRKSGDDAFYSAPEIKCMMKDAGYSGGVIHGVAGDCEIGRAHV